MGISQSTASSTQEAIQNISQSYSGTCAIDCTNDINNVSVIIDHSNYTGDINFQQACSVDGQCQINSSMNAAASIFFTAANSASASNAVDVLPWPNADFSNTSSYQSMRQNITQTNNETCKLSSSNNMSNILVFMEDTNYTGNINFSQIGNTTGACALTNSMDAVANATGESTNNAESGKKAKSMSGSLEMVAAFVVLIVLIVVFIAIIKAMSGKKKKGKGKTSSSTVYTPLQNLPSYSLQSNSLQSRSLPSRVQSAPLRARSSIFQTAPMMQSAPAVVG